MPKILPFLLLSLILFLSCTGSGSPGEGGEKGQGSFWQKIQNKGGC